MMSYLDEQVHIFIVKLSKVNCRDWKIGSAQSSGGHTDFISFNDESLDQHSWRSFDRTISQMVIILLSSPVCSCHFSSLSFFLTNQSRWLLRVAQKIMWNRHNSQYFKLQRENENCFFCCGRSGFLGLKMINQSCNVCWQFLSKADWAGSFLKAPAIYSKHTWDAHKRAGGT